METLLNIVSLGLGILAYFGLRNREKKKQIERDCNPYLYHSDEVNKRIHGIEPKGRDK
ncbi:MAG: hypothetical protein PHF63_04620 [Herbinix sp.]|nr:hypothetical protein [Herbinix sp.]